MEKVNLKSLTFEELQNLFKNINEPKFRSQQVFEWLSKGVTSFDEMTNISKSLREKLSEISYISSLKIVQKLVSKIDKTTKFLFKLDDGNTIESVVMYYKHGISICISSEVGCKMGCRFCASTLGGLVRRLEAGEILDQVIFAQKEIGMRISNIVIMGIGEPLDNYENIIKFLKNVNHPSGLNIGYRHISLSTCGLVDKIEKLAEEKLPITLSISLHAPNNEIRNKLMPVNKKYNMEKLLSACRSYAKKTDRRITFEYTLISGVNDSEENAMELARKLSGILCHINLIPVNSIKERDYKKADQKNIYKFQKILTDFGYTATVRRELGSDISASCGQLRQNCENRGD